MDYYAILGINRDADVADVQKACAHGELCGVLGAAERGTDRFQLRRAALLPLVANRKAQLLEGDGDPHVPRPEELTTNNQDQIGSIHRITWHRP